MTEELEQKAKKWVKENACDWCVNADECKQGCIDCHGISGYIAGATELQEEMKKDLVSKLKELISYSTSPSCTKGMELFIKRIENWEFIK